MKNPLQLLAVVIVASTLFAACRSAGARDADSFRTIARGYQSGIIGPCAEVARNEHEWKDLWARHTSTVLPRPDLPPVDFDHDMVVFASVGVRPTTGYALEIERVVPENGDLVVQAVERQPARDAILPQVASQPFHIIAMPQHGGRVRLSTEISSAGISSAETQGPSNL